MVILFRAIHLSLYDILDPQSLKSSAIILDQERSQSKRPLPRESAFSSSNSLGKRPSGSMYSWLLTLGSVMMDTGRLLPSRAFLDALHDRIPSVKGHVSRKGSSGSI